MTEACDSIRKETIRGAFLTLVGITIKNATLEFRPFSRALHLLLSVRYQPFGRPSSQVVVSFCSCPLEERVVMSVLNSTATASPEASTGAIISFVETLLGLYRYISHFKGDDLCSFRDLLVSLCVGSAFICGAVMYMLYGITTLQVGSSL